MLRDLAGRASNGRSKSYIAKIYECEVGFLCYDDWSDQGNGFIYEIFVLPEYRGQGVGHSLLLYSEELAKSLRCASIRLEPHAFDRTVDSNWLVSWYLRQGYSPMPNDSKKMEKVLVST
ncbi:GNAT family N-acetyltransferase [Vreelandella sp. F11]|uniref:GNAT family N-acetyltransferase n=1 Tax=Vreelandella sp. F11 TaxID=3394751 RepID=UPI0036DF2039